MNMHTVRLRNQALPMPMPMQPEHTVADDWSQPVINRKSVLMSKNEMG